tara:strand:+ start:1392 stop:1724 length:333 start_codon:yes stop_codon:yes gene_type:complete
MVLRIRTATDAEKAGAVRYAEDHGLPHKRIEWAIDDGDGFAMDTFVTKEEAKAWLTKNAPIEEARVKALDMAEDIIDAAIRQIEAECGVDGFGRASALDALRSALEDRER